MNRELVTLYWQIGRDILDRQKKAKWGSQIIDRLSVDLRKAFPGTRGFSTRNLKYMRKLAESYPEESFVQQVAAQIPWFHNCVLLDKVKDTQEREWYIHQTVQNGWSRNVLVLQIESDLYRRQGKAISNFKQALLLGNGEPGPRLSQAKIPPGVGCTKCLKIDRFVWRVHIR